MTLTWSDYFWMAIIAAIAIYGLWWRKKYY